MTVRAAVIVTTPCPVRYENLTVLWYKAITLKTKAAQKVLLHKSAQTPLRFLLNGVPRAVRLLRCLAWVSCAAELQGGI